MTFHASQPALERSMFKVSSRATADDEWRFHAPFSGIHGWFWENRGLTTVTVKLNASGFFFRLNCISRRR